MWSRFLFSQCVWYSCHPKFLCWSKNQAETILLLPFHLLLAWLLVPHHKLTYIYYSYRIYLSIRKSNHLYLKISLTLGWNKYCFQSPLPIEKICAPMDSYLLYSSVQLNIYFRSFYFGTFVGRSSALIGLNMCKRHLKILSK